MEVLRSKNPFFRNWFYLLSLKLIICEKIEFFWCYMLLWKVHYGVLISTHFWPMSGIYILAWSYLVPVLQKIMLPAWNLSTLLNDVCIIFFNFGCISLTCFSNFSFGTCPLSLFWLPFKGGFCLNCSSWETHKVFWFTLGSATIGTVILLVLSIAL